MKTDTRDGTAELAGMAKGFVSEITPGKRVVGLRFKVGSGIGATS